MFKCATWYILVFVYSNYHHIQAMNILFTPTEFPQAPSKSLHVTSSPSPGSHGSSFYYSYLVCIFQNFIYIICLPVFIHHNYFEMYPYLSILLFTSILFYGYIYSFISQYIHSPIVVSSLGLYKQSSYKHSHASSYRDICFSSLPSSGIAVSYTE